MVVSLRSFKIGLTMFGHETSDRFSLTEGEALTTTADVPRFAHRATKHIASQQAVFWGLTVLLLVLAMILHGSIAGVGLLFAAASIASLACLSLGLSWHRRQAKRRHHETVALALEAVSCPAFSTGAEGTLFHANSAAKERFGDFDQDDTIHSALAELIADPSGLVRQMLERAWRDPVQDESVATRRGMVRVQVHAAGEDCLIWRLTDLSDEPLHQGNFHAEDGVPIFVCEPYSTSGRGNPALIHLLGRNPEKLEDIFSDLPLQVGAEHSLETTRGSEKRFAYEIIRPDGSVEVYVLPVELGINQRNGWQFFDALPVPMLKIGHTGDVLMANRLARELLAHRAPLGAHLSDLVEGLGRSISDWLGDATRGHGLNRTEVIRAIHPPKDVYLQITLGRIEDEGETALVAVLNDATELKSLEAQFVQSQKMQAIGQLAGGVAHDFNNLLTAISGHCDLMLLRHDETDPDYADLIQVHQNANRAASLVGQLLAFSRKQQLQLEYVDLRETMSDLTHLLNRLVGEKVRLTLDHDTDLNLVRADKRQLEQVIMNLVVNARDAMPEGGKIRIETRGEHLPQTLARDRVEVPAGDYVVVRVTDEGVGISPDNLTKVFEPFWSTKRTGEGTGLGLSTAYGIIKQTGGFIFVDSQVDVGTVFTIYLQARTAPEDNSTEAIETSDVATDPIVGGVVLLVEDEAPVRAFASRALRMHGFDVLEADSAEAALQTLEDDELSVDVFVTDVIMPGMDGPTWVKEALKRRPDTKVVFVSGYAEDAISENQARIVNAVFLPKPFSLNDLTSTVQAQIG